MDHNPTDKEKEFYLLLAGWSKIGDRQESCWNNAKLYAYWHYLDTAYALEMRKRGQQPDR